MEIYKKVFEQNGSKEIIRVLGILLYKKIVFPDRRIKKTYLYGLFKTVKIASCTEFYIFGIRFYKKYSILEELKFLKNKLNDIYYNMHVITQVPYVHSYFKEYKNCNFGKDVILFAGGPSVHFYKNNLIPNAVKCGVNGIIRIFDDLDYLFVEDFYVNEKGMNDEIDSYKGNNCQKFYGILPNRRINHINRINYVTERIKPANFINSKAKPFLIEDVVASKWAVDLEREAFGDFQGAALSALQFLIYTRPRKIFLVGNDCSGDKLAYNSLRSTDLDHSFKIRFYIEFKKFAQRIYPEVEIISLNPVNLKGIFKDVYTKDFAKENNLDLNNLELIGD